MEKIVKFMPDDMNTVTPPPMPVSTYEMQLKHPQINANTAVSIGLLVVLLTGIITILNAIYSSKYEFTRRMDDSERNQKEMRAQQDAIVIRLNKAETLHESWSFQDMFKYLVRLQRENDGQNGRPRIVVPDPVQSQTP